MFDTPPLTELSVGVCASLIVLAVSLVGRCETRHLLSAWGGAIALALVALGLAPAVLVIFVAVTIAGSELVVAQRKRRLTLMFGWVGTVLVLTASIDTTLRLASLASTAVAGLALEYSYRRNGSAVTLVLIAGTAIGIYINVPDTEQIALVGAGLSVLAVLSMIWQPLRTMKLGIGALGIVGALVVCAGAVGARGQPSEFVAVVGALGVLIVEPVAAVVRRGRRSYSSVLIVVHAGAALVVSRSSELGGDRSGLVMAGLVLLAATAFLVVAPRRPIGLATGSAVEAFND